jgi:hypothetical protein
MLQRSLETRFGFEELGLNNSTRSSAEGAARIRRPGFDAMPLLTYDTAIMIAEPVARLSAACEHECDPQPWFGAFRERD